MRIVRLDHLVLTVADIEATVAFYVRVMGMEEVVFGAQGRKALVFGEQKINLHERGKEFEPKAGVAMPGSADLCFLVEGEIGAVVAHLERERVEILEGPVVRTGACFAIDSVYFRDLDGNLIELSCRKEA